MVTRLSHPRQGGFTYMAVILIVAMMGAALGVAGQVWRTAQQREKEKELLFIGNEYRQAIGRYVERSPGGARRFPPRLEDLISDSRYPSIQRHLRRLYRDPMSNSLDWGIVRASDGGIAGVYSKSQQKPMKIAGFAPWDARLESAEKYSDWHFVYEGRLRPPPPPPRGAPGGPSGSEPPTMFPD